MAGAWLLLLSVGGQAAGHGCWTWFMAGAWLLLLSVGGQAAGHGRRRDFGLSLAWVALGRPGWRGINQQASAVLRNISS
ncbi:hypothetical protein HaLaN_06064, partial [Haematococcus lacustris]